MALPKLETPTHELVLPSTNKKIKFRPFLVKEQKILYMAQNSKSESEIVNSVGQLVSNCTFGEVDPDIAPMFDIEYIFIKLRSKSVGETIELSVLCPDDNKTRVPVKIKLDDVDKVFNIFIKCIHEVHHKEKIYNAVDVTTKDLETFVEQMTTSQLQSIMSFFDSMPKLRHVVQVTNPNTKKKGEVVVEGLQNFLG